MVFEGLTLLSMLVGIAGAFVMLFFPGYFVGLGLFPSKKDLESLERFVVSIAFSLTFPPFLLLLSTSFLGLKIDFLLVLLIDLVVMLSGLVLFFGRTKRIVFPAFFYRFFPQVQKQDAVGLLLKP